MSGYHATSTINTLLAYGLKFRIFIVFFLYSVLSFGQSLHIKGKVMNVTNTDPIGYATVAAIGSTTEASTDVYGVFILNVKQNFTQTRISFFGFEFQCVII